jgi:dipeptidyl-peptidase 4
MAAMAVLRRPDVFRAGFAVAPVADWRDYDTHYTERYLGLPEANPDGYANSSPVTFAADLRQPLLVMHGTVDDNVYFFHSLALVRALFRAGREFEFVPLVGFTHSVPDPLMTTRIYDRLVSWFTERLAPAGR